MRTFIVYSIVLAFILVAAVHPASALSAISIPFITTGNAVFTSPNSNTALTILEFNSASTTSQDLEAVNINFPLNADDLNAGPTVLQGSADIGGITTSGSATSNVLPFGPVNLAFPSIAQTVSQSYGSQQTYFFTDTFSS